MDVFSCGGMVRLNTHLIRHFVHHVLELLVAMNLLDCITSLVVGRVLCSSDFVEGRQLMSDSGVDINKNTATHRHLQYQYINPDRLFS
jgi:hypothetical protein